MHNGKYVLFRKETKVYLEVEIDGTLLEGDYDLNHNLEVLRFFNLAIC